MNEEYYILSIEICLLSFGLKKSYCMHDASLQVQKHVENQ